MSETRVDSIDTEPVDVVRERLNDPGVAASIVTLLDNAELLSTLVLGLSSFMERGDSIMDAVAESVNDLKAAGGPAKPEGLPSVSDISALAGQLGAAAPVLTNLLESPIAAPETIDALGSLTEAATEGMANAASNNTEVSGAFSLMRSLKDPDVAKGLGVLIEVAKSLGKRV